jgi:hypothetical protein
MTLGIIGTLTGIVGAITGLVGLVLGWTNYRHLQQIKALDLRLELRKQVSDVRADVEALPTLLEQARASRSAVRAAMGRGQQSGDNLIWKDELENDLMTVQTLAHELPDAKETYLRSKHQELENMLVVVHTLATKAVKIHIKYETALASDARDRDYIRANAPRGFK